MTEKKKAVKQSRRVTRIRTRRFDKHGWKQIYEDLLKEKESYILDQAAEIAMLKGLNPFSFTWYKLKLWNMRRKVQKAMDDPDGPARRRAAIQPTIDKIMEDNKK